MTSYLTISILKLFSTLTSDYTKELIENVVTIERNRFTGEFFKGNLSRLDEFAELDAYIETS
jgi:hypothetical protein